LPDKVVTKLSQVKVGSFIRLVDRDKQGKFSYVGEVTVVTKDPPHFEMITMEGTMGFCMATPTANELHMTTTKPTGWHKFKNNPSKFRESKAVHPPKTKRQLVFELVAKNTRKGEPALLKLAKKEIGGSDIQLLNFIKLALAKK